MRKRKSDTRFSIFSMIVFFLLTVSLQSQDPVFVAHISSTRISQNAVFEIQFELKNANGQEFQPPRFDDFRVVAGPSTGMSTTIINGRVSRSESWSYSLLAHKAGNFTVGAATVVAGRRKLSTKPVSITVLEAGEASRGTGEEPGEEDIRLIASVKQGDFYPGQQIVLTYKLLFTQNIQSANAVSEDDYSDFFVQHFNGYNPQSGYEMINGVNYVSRVVKSLALFAHQSGQYTIDPLVLMLGIDAPYPTQQGFFTMRRLHNVQVASQPLLINILPLPADDADQNFSGAVGHYSIITSPVNGTQITTDDDLNIRVEIRGNGDARRWDPPLPVIDGEFEMYDPRIVEDNVMQSEGFIEHVRIIEYTMIPIKPGAYEVYIPFRFYNPDNKRYETVYSDTIALQVTQGSNLARRGITDTSSVVPRALKKVNQIKTDDRFWLSIPHIFLFGLVAGGTLWGLWSNYRKRRMEAIPAAERMRSAASRHARHQLDELTRMIRDIPDQLFFARLTEIYYRFLEERFNIPPADVDSDKIRDYFQKANVDDNISGMAIQFFEQCLVLRYAGIPAGSTKDELITKCREVIDKLDRNSPVHSL